MLLFSWSGLVVTSGPWHWGRAKPKWTELCHFSLSVETPGNARVMPSLGILEKAIDCLTELTPQAATLRSLSESWLCTELESQQDHWKISWSYSLREGSKRLTLVKTKEVLTKNEGMLQSHRNHDGGAPEVKPTAQS